MEAAPFSAGLTLCSFSVGSSRSLLVTCKREDTIPFGALVTCLQLVPPSNLSSDNFVNVQLLALCIANHHRIELDAKIEVSGGTFLE